MNHFLLQMAAKTTLWLLVLALCLAPTAIAGDSRAPQPGPRDKCPVCGMFVVKYPDWVAGIGFRDGTWVFFDGAKDMFKYLLNMKRYSASRTAADVADVSVKDYYALEVIDGRRAYYVEGGDVFGPMGRELVPFGKEAHAREFMSDHKGKRVLKFEEVTIETLKALD